MNTNMSQPTTGHSNFMLVYSVLHVKLTPTILKNAARVNYAMRQCKWNIVSTRPISDGLV